MTQAVRVTVQRRLARAAPATPAPRALTPVEYVRQARRLRARHGGDLGRLHAALATLTPTPARSVAPAAPNLPAIPWGGVNGGLFAEQVRLAMDGPVLRYSARLQLLADANRLKIRRFDANLIIAWVVQNSTPSREVLSPSSDAAGPYFRISATLVTFLILQSAIIAAALWLWAIR